MDQILMELEARKEALEKEYHDAMSRYRSDLLKLEHEIVERSKAISRSVHGTEAPEDGWNAEHEGVVKIDKREGEHLFEREKVYDGGTENQ